MSARKRQSTRGVNRNDPAASKQPRARKQPRPRTGGRSARVVTDVLSAALTQFSERGYAGLSIEDVAVLAGVNKTTVYRRWPTKAALIEAALFSLRDADPPPPDTGSLAEDLTLVLGHWAAEAATPRRRAISVGFLLGGPDPDLQRMIRRFREERPALPRALFERAMKRGELPRGADVTLISTALLSPLHSRIYWKREDVTEQFIRELVELVLAGARALGTR